MTITTHPSHASFLRRLGAILYDLLMILAILMISTWLLMPLTGGNPIRPGDLAYQLYLLLVCSGYYIGFWVFGGQTVGMRAWRIKLQTLAGTPLSWEQATKRLLWAVLTLIPCGLGLWVALFQKQRRAWYDVLAGTIVIRYNIPK
jgi:uncharacterized RDD family membrane protein YckC